MPVPVPPFHFNAAIEPPEASGYMHIIRVPPDVFHAFEGKKPVRVVVSVAGKASWKAGLMSLGNGGGYISVSKQKIKTSGLAVGKKLPVTLEPDTDKETWPLPPEMDAALAFDDEARAFYEQLTDGKKRSITIFVGQAKSEQIRVDRALLVTENLRRYKGNVSVQQLFKKPA